MKADGETQKVKVVFRFGPNAWHKHATESMWVTPMGESSFRLENVPFYARNVSFGDVVRARRIRGLFVATSVAQRSGHSTYRIFSEQGESFDSSANWKRLERLGCTYERANKKLIAIDCPPKVDADRVYKVLKDGKSSGQWDFEEGHFSAPAEREKIAIENPGWE